jgi:hypothetical protein
MKKKRKKINDDNGKDMLKEYDFSSGVRGKYDKRLKKGNNIIILDKDLVKSFPDGESVNETLRAVVKISRIVKMK